MAGLFYEIAVLLFLAIGAEGESTWTYPNRSKDPDSDWKDHYPHCGENSQSPINIDVPMTVYDSTLKSLAFTGYAAAQNGTVVNNGHSLQYNPTSGTTSTIKDGPLEGSTYTLAQFHFHLGSTDLTGSEHTIDGSQFPAEMHFVHYNSGKYSSISRAANESDGLAVIGAFVKIGNANSQIDSLHIDKLLYKGDKANVSKLIVWNLLPANKTYYTYKGSLTTPPCYESVRWIVLTDTITMSSSQMATFRRAKGTERGDNTTHLMANNYRDVQPLNGRSVRRNFMLAVRTTPSSSTHTATPTSGDVQLVVSKIAVCLQLALIVLFVKVFGM